MPEDGAGTISEATPGFCTSDCKTLYPYLIANFLFSFCGTLLMMPTFIVTIRSVTEADKPLAIGLTVFMHTLLGWFPGPVAFGRIVDSACVIWSSGCSSDGSCSLYDIEAFRYRLYGVLSSTSVGQLLLFIAAFVVMSRIRAPFVQHRDNEIVEVIFPESEKMIKMEKRGTVDCRSGDEKGDDCIIGSGKMCTGNPDV